MNKDVNLMIFVLTTQTRKVLMNHLVQWNSVNRDSDKGDIWLIGIEIGKPFTT